MAKRLTGKEVAADLLSRCRQKSEDLHKKGVRPCLAIVRVGENADDLYYQESLERETAKAGIECRVFPLPLVVSDELLQNSLRGLSDDPSVHGILLFCPLPEHLDEEAARAAIDPQKDVDGLTKENAAALYSGDANAFAPCTAAAVVELLRYYQVPLTGQQVVIIGRSLVVGKPLAMLLLANNATVTICHSKSRDLPEVCRAADILISAVGKAKNFAVSFTSPWQTVVDVGINPDPLHPGKICGDFVYESVEPQVEAITPVPGGVGTVTTAMLCYHTLRACEAQSE